MTPFTSPQRGFWCVTAHPVALEVAASVNPDFICIDLQHGADWSAVTVNTFTALSSFGADSYVRVPSNNHTDIGRALDLGADGVIVPMVNSRAEAEAAADACRYPGRGSRSSGVQTPRRPAGMDVRCAVQIETAEAVEDVEAIAAVDGIDILYVGPLDLGLSLTGTEPPDVVDLMEGTDDFARTMCDAFDRVVEAARQAGKVAGLHCGDARGGLLAEARGFSFTTIATDVTVMRREMAAQLELVRGGRR